uniref:Phylloseptin-8 n=1 Tax=Phyllomedusa tomopterna TaxID=248868 RepID=PLS8_PHYTM|nr:RecName: Full=Phylloseptin-8; Short=PS-8; AltName: Full=Phylloseptin-TO8; Short=PLS-TO8 [Phyllomedusa tomopterna]
FLSLIPHAINAVSALAKHF